MIIPEIDPKFPDCPIRNILARIGDKWSTLVLYTLNLRGTLRYNELQKELPDISQKMLSTTLRTLEVDGLVRRQPYPVVPPRVEYTLTPRAETLMPHISALIGWAKDNMQAILADREAARNER